MRLMYGTPPDPSRWSREVEPQMIEAIARARRERAEQEALGKALWNLLAPLTGEDDIP